MARVEMINTTYNTGLSETQSDFELVAQQVDKNKQALGEASSGEDNVVTEQDVVDMVIEQTVINETIRRMKADQQRLEEIIDEV
ncbi:hypothetical protein OW495_05915 [Vibrio sp. 14N.309.X.WAT.E.F5]|uniref:hypothetical protein n=1 Tax=Vibrio TaxID=662 RepID=UPI0002DC41DC|nr:MULTISPECIES: hypothetical protein [Vibrio]MDN2666245.1 hypothetical protein [Vibrio sp. 14N.309.X.WAT.E.F5]OCH65358.1 hypothetical protein A6E08_14035 [Vibrio lentus]PMH95292.1 hypothetical protein BCU54_13175 [Vibrio lentus]PMI55874.1 hypothetical protein BCU41_12775 [Vibrio lentus]PMJ87405.1 hypothetical protein BCU13_10660 [Vibrio lentus]